MIPHRMASRENSGSAVRYRVAACRKRLRETRVINRTQLVDEESETCREAENPGYFEPEIGNTLELATRMGLEAEVT